MIVFNTRKKAEHYIKHKDAQHEKFVRSQEYYNDEEFNYYIIDDSTNNVLNIFGWRCGCGCDRGSSSATVIGRIKKLNL